MKKQLILSAACAAMTLAAVTGCSTTTENYDATDTTSENRIRSLSSVSQADCLEAARAAVKDALSSPAFTAYLEEYKAANGNKRPLLQISDYLRNDTNDPDLNMSLITDELTKALRDSGKVRVTLATGRDASGTFADARDLKRDKNFNKATVAKEGTLNAPSLTLEGKIITSMTRDGRKTVKVTNFNLKMADITTGEEIWSYNKPIGMLQTRSAFGY